MEAIESEHSQLHGQADYGDSQIDLVPEEQVGCPLLAWFSIDTMFLVMLEHILRSSKAQDGRRRK